MAIPLPSSPSGGCRASFPFPFSISSTSPISNILFLLRFYVEDMQASKQECMNSIIGKVITHKGVHLGGLKTAMEVAWSFPKGLKVLDLGTGLYQFIFSQEMDMLKVLSGGPWLFNNQLLVLQRWRVGMKPDQLFFGDCPFWIQVRNLPLECMSIEVGKKMFKAFGAVQEVALAQLSGNRGRCLRVKVELDITKPLPRGKRICSADWEPFWISFQYEKLPILCHYCGLIGHDDKVCVDKDKDLQAGCLRENQFGAWLRASPVKAFRRTGGRRDSPPDASSSDGDIYGNPLFSGGDKRNPGLHGVTKTVRKQIEWGSLPTSSENQGDDSAKSNKVAENNSSSSNHRSGALQKRSGNVLGPGLNSGVGQEVGLSSDSGVGQAVPIPTDLVDVEIQWKSFNPDSLTEGQLSSWEAAEQELARNEDINEAIIPPVPLTFSSQRKGNDSTRDSETKGSTERNAARVNNRRLHVKPKEGVLQSKGIIPSLAGISSKAGGKRKFSVNPVYGNGSEVEVTSPAKKARHGVIESQEGGDFIMAESGLMDTVGVASRDWPQSVK